MVWREVRKSLEIIQDTATDGIHQALNVGLARRGLVLNGHLKRVCDVSEYRVRQEDMWMKPGVERIRAALKKDDAAGAGDHFCVGSARELPFHEGAPDDASDSAGQFGTETERTGELWRERENVLSPSQIRSENPVRQIGTAFRHPAASAAGTKATFAGKRNNAGLSALVALKSQKALGKVPAIAHCEHLVDHELWNLECAVRLSTDGLQEVLQMGGEQALDEAPVRVGRNQLKRIDIVRHGDTRQPEACQPHLPMMLVTCR